MADLTDLSSLAGSAPLTAAQVQGIINQIDLDIVNLARDGKLGTAIYTQHGSAGMSMDRASAMKALRETRDYYWQILQQIPTIVVSQYQDPDL